MERMPFDARIDTPGVARRAMAEPPHGGLYGTSMLRLFGATPTYARRWPPARNRISDDMITGLLIALAVGAGFTALFFAAASGISLQYGNKPRAISTGWLAIGLLAAALVAGWG